MKNSLTNSLLALLTVFCAAFLDAQIALAKPDGTPIANGQIFTYSSTADTQATLYYKIKNTSSAAIRIRMKIVNLQNTSGSGFQFCYLNVCLPSVALNAVYPNNSASPIIIAGNSETPSSGYNMWNSNPGSGVFPLEYTVKYYLVDNANAEYGTPFTVTYRYDPAFLSTAEVKERDPFATLSATLVTDEIEMVSEENNSYSVYNAEGRCVQQGMLNKGINRLDFRSQAKGMYFVHLKNRAGSTASRKVVKK